MAALTGVIFVFAGLVKFVFHHWELNAFRSFGLPWPAALEIVAGALETLGGVLLVARRFTGPVAALLAVTMIVAIASSGIGHGDVIPSLTLAPALLIATLYIIARGLAPRTGTDELRATGARPRRAAFTGADALVSASQWTAADRGSWDCRGASGAREPRSTSDTIAIGPFSTVAVTPRQAIEALLGRTVEQERVVQLAALRVSAGPGDAAAHHVIGTAPATTRRTAVHEARALA